MHVVIIDPSRVILQKITAELEGSGCYVDCFCYSDQAQLFIQHNQTVDVVLTSLEVEPVSGLELCWTLRSLVGPDRPLHIIVMSSNTSERALSEALDSGADDFIVKPVRREELKARLRAADRLMALQRQLVEQAQIDPLTGLLNRRAFIDRATEARRELDASEPLAICLFDIDNFSLVNKAYGHDLGDTVITTVGQIACEEASVVARLGGEEYVMIFPTLDATQASHWCETIRTNIADRAFEGPEGSFHVTCSFGLSEWRAGERLTEALERAEMALREAQKAGFNRVVIDTPATEPAETRLIA
jgi:diguanylate cyclase (GGDEF)-like protein